MSTIDELKARRDELLARVDSAPPATDERQTAWNDLYRFDQEHWETIYGDTITVPLPQKQRDAIRAAHENS